MTEIQRQLISIIAHQLFGEKLTVSETVDWNGIIKESRLQAVFPIVFSCMETSLSHKSIDEQYRQQYAESCASSIKSLYYHNELHRMLSAYNVPYVILKGQASAYYYPQSMLRTMGDVDFLINSSDVNKVDNILYLNGFSRLSNTEKHGFHWVYKKHRESLEMHWSIPGVPNTNNRVINGYLEDIIEKRIIIRNSDGEYAIPTAFHHGIVLLFHIISHMTSSGIGLRHLCDWLVFENSMEEKEFTTIFEKPLNEIGLWMFAQVLTKIGVEYFGCEDRKWCGSAKVTVCKALLEDILTGGNFGVKDNTRKSQAKLIRDNTTREVTDRSVIHNLFVSINEKAKSDYQVMKEKPVLLPVGWILVCIKYFIHIVTGERNNVFSKSVFADALNRKKLYSELKLFEPHEPIF